MTLARAGKGMPMGWWIFCLTMLSATPDAGHPDGGTKARVMTREVQALVDRVQGFYEKTTDFRSHFRQEYAYTAFKRTQVSEGTVLYQKPGKMRWDYEKPSKRTFVLAKDKVYALDPDALTLTKANLDTNQLSAAVTFLFGKGKLADEFFIEKTACPSCQGQLLTLLPKRPDPRFERVQLEVDLKTAQVLQSTVTDPDGSRNTIRFSDLKTNVGLQAAAFDLTTPPNTQVIDLTRTAPAPLP